MNLISNYDLDNTQFSFQQLKNLAQIVKRTIRCTSSIFVQEAQENLQIYVTLCKVNGRDLVGKITLFLNGVISLDTLLTDACLFTRCRSSFQTTTIIRYFLKQNASQHTFIYKVNPVSGIFSIGKSISLPKTFCQKQAIETMIENLSELQDKLKQEYSKILEIINDDSVPYQKNQDLTARTLKVYVQSSSSYAWKALEGHSKGKQIDSQPIYESMKKSFRRKRGSIITSKMISLIQQACLTTKSELYPFFVLTSSQDSQLYERYLQSRTGFKRNSKLVSKVSIQNICIENIMDNKVFEVETKECEQLKILAHQKDPKHLQYEKKVINVLKDVQFVGLPRYFHLESYPEINNKFSLSNLYESISFQKFLSSNKKSMSFGTKLSMLNIIIRTLRYLRDCGVVYNNLRPSTIKVRKGLIPKLSDFSNAYHETIAPIQDSFKDYFPYVSIIKSFYRTYSYQKTDSFSFAALTFYALFGKTMRFVRSSVIPTMTANERQRTLWKGEVFALQNCNLNGGAITKVLLKMIMDSMKHKEPEDLFLDRTQDQTTGLEERPYLDWHQIVLQKIEEYSSTLSP